MTKPCAVCGSETDKVIYFGLPGRLCRRWTCGCHDGAAACAPYVATETDDGPAFAYFFYQGSYWLALWRWLIGRDE